MKQLLMMVIALAALPGSALHAQDIAGTWQGTLKAGNRDLRVVFKISLEGNNPKAVMYSIDQGAQGTPASAVSRTGATIKIAVASMRGTYEGKLNANGNAIAGTWSQGTPLPLNLVRAAPETAWAIPETLPPPVAMPADANPVFEVATIKPSQSNGSVTLRVNPSGLFTTSGTSVSDLIKFAYDLHAQQIIDGPAWLENEKCDVSARPDKAGRPSLGQLKSMVQKLLTDRFQLTFHRDKRTLSVYAITLARSGAKLTRNDSDPNGLFGGVGIGAGSLSFRNITMAEFATMLQAAGNISDRPVVDQTGLGSVRYDLALRWTPDGPQSQQGGAERATDDAPPDLFAAFQQQLGLKLESTKAPADVLVIDRAAKPSEN